MSFPSKIDQSPSKIICFVWSLFVLPNNSWSCIALFCFTERRLWDLLPPLEPEHGTHHLRWTPLCSRHQTEPSWNCCSSLYSTFCFHLDADVILSRAKDSLFRQQVHCPSLLLAWDHRSSQVHSTYLSHLIKKKIISDNKTQTQIFFLVPIVELEFPAKTSRKWNSGVGGW